MDEQVHIQYCSEYLELNKILLQARSYSKGEGNPFAGLAILLAPFSTSDTYTPTEPVIANICDPLHWAFQHAVLRALREKMDWSKANIKIESETARWDMRFIVTIEGPKMTELPE